MKRTTGFFIVSLSLALMFISASVIRAEIDIGEYTLSGSAEVDGLPRNFSGSKTQFDLYRDVPETLVVPQLQLLIGAKKEDFYLSFDSYKPGREDQNYRLRFGRYGLLDFEFEWDQIPHAFNIDNARTPYVMNGGTYTLPLRTTSVNGTIFSNWVNDNARSVDLSLLEKLAKVSLRYTPAPGWTFTGRYWNQNNDGLRPFGIINGNNSSGNVSELAEPINYHTNNLELGGEYAGKDWSIALKYNGSLFHNSTSTLVWDNPLRPVGAGPCVDQTTYSTTAGTGPCRGRLDLYPSNQAHTFSLTGNASLPWKTQFLGTASYGWRLQDDSFLPMTNNRCYTNDPTLVGTLDVSRCQTSGGAAQALRLMPSLSRGSLNGDVRPTMVNLTFVNTFFDHLNLKTYYRLYDLDSRTSNVSTTGTILNDQGNVGSLWTNIGSYQYSKNTMGFQSSYDFTRWLTGKFNVTWDRTHRDIPQIPSGNEALNATETKIGPTFDIKPLSWLLVRASYQHSWRSDPGYSPSLSDGSEMFFLTKRTQNKASLFTDVSPWETLSFHAAFDFIGNDYPEATYRLQSSHSYSPSVGVTYEPLDWLKLFADYNYDRSRWNENYDANIRSHGIDTVNTFSLGSDIDIIKDLLGFRIQYAFSQGSSQIINNNNNRWPDNSNTWQELLTRFEYKLYKNVSAQLGYYFNRFHSKDYGVDIMKLWMGDLDTNAGQLRSIYLGDQFKGSYTAHVGMIGLKFKF